MSSLFVFSYEGQTFASGDERVSAPTMVTTQQLPRPQPTATTVLDRTAEDRTANTMEDSSDDDSFELEMQKSSFKRVGSGRNSAQAKKARRDQALNSVLNSALESGEQKLVQENRMLGIQKRNSEVRSPMALDEARRASKIESAGGGDNDIAKDLFASKNTADHNEPVDIKATACLGSRSTLNLCRLVNATDDNGKPNPVTSCSWSNMIDALGAFKGAVQWEQQHIIQQQEKSLSASSRKFDEFCEEILEQASSARNFTFCLQEMWLSAQPTERIQCVPPSLLHWLFVMACAPVTIKIGNGEATDWKSISVDVSLLSAKQGAYKTLHGLWSHRNGLPSQQKCLLTLDALPDQLREWFGSTCMVDKEEKGETVADNENSNHVKDIVYVGSPCALVRFLHLWALALENGLVAVDRIQTDGGAEVSSAIMALMWAALDPVFGSSHRLVKLVLA